MALVAQCWNRLLAGGGSTAAPSPLFHCLSAARSYHRARYEVKVGIPEFLKGVGNGVEAHVAKLEVEIGDFQKLLVTRTLRLKNLSIPCKHDIEVFGCASLLHNDSMDMYRIYSEIFFVGIIFVLVILMGGMVGILDLSLYKRKLILNYSQKYRLGLWRPRAEPQKP